MAAEDATPACRWGILGTGKICYDFAQVLIRHVPGINLIILYKNQYKSLYCDFKPQRHTLQLLLLFFSMSLPAVPFSVFV